MPSFKGWGIYAVETLLQLNRCFGAPVTIICKSIRARCGHESRAEGEHTRSGYTNGGSTQQFTAGKSVFSRVIILLSQLKAYKRFEAILAPVKSPRAPISLPHTIGCELLKATGIFTISIFRCLSFLGSLLSQRFGFLSSIMQLAADIFDSSLKGRIIKCCGIKIEAVC